MQEKKAQGGAWWRRGWVLIVGAAVGVMLILLGNTGTQWFHARDETGDEMGTEQDALLIYTAQLERKIERLCEGVSGVSDVRVIVSLDGDFTGVYAVDSETVSQTDGERQSTEYVTVGSGSSEQTVLLTRTPPDIRGIGVVCRGGGDAAARQELTSLLSAAFSIGTNKIYIAEANP